MSVFTSCPSALNVDGYVNEQVSAIAQLAVQVSGTFVTGEIAEYLHSLLLCLPKVTNITQD